MKDGIGRDDTAATTPGSEPALCALGCTCPEGNLASIWGVDELSGRTVAISILPTRSTGVFVGQGEDETVRSSRRSIWPGICSACFPGCADPSARAIWQSITTAARINRRRENHGPTAHQGAANQNTLLSLKRQVRFLEDGHAPLSKRELLTRLVYQHINEYRGSAKTLTRQSNRFYHWMGISFPAWAAARYNRGWPGNETQH